MIPRTIRDSVTKYMHMFYISSEHLLQKQHNVHTVWNQILQVSSSAKSTAHSSLGKWHSEGHISIHALHYFLYILYIITFATHNIGKCKKLKLSEHLVKWLLIMWSYYYIWIYPTASLKYKQLIIHHKTKHCLEDYHSVVETSVNSFVVN